MADENRGALIDAALKIPPQPWTRPTWPPQAPSPNAPTGAAAVA